MEVEGREDGVEVDTVSEPGDSLLPRSSSNETKVVGIFFFFFTLVRGT